jgi:hypothetical protein
LLLVLARRGHSGRLAISLDGEEIQLFLDAGQIVSVTSSNHGLRLGQMLGRLRVLNPERLEEAVREQEELGSPLPLGEILLQKGWVTRADLARGAEEQCIEVLVRVIVARQGTFMFSRDAAPRAATALVTLNTDGIVLEASRRADEMITLQSLLPADTAKLWLTHLGTGQLSGFTAQELRVLETLAQGAGTLAELTQRLPGDDIALWRAVVALRERGVVVARSSTGGSGLLLANPQLIATRLPEEIVALGREGRSGRHVPDVPTLAEIRIGAAASAQTVAAVTLVAREVIAAFNAGAPLRAFVHFSDDHFRRQGELTPEEIAVLQAPVQPLPPEEQETVIALREARLLPDGRVSAILVSHYPAVGDSRKVLIFVRTPDRWLIDAVIEVPHSTANPAAHQPQTNGVSASR